jgi:hypothetical protein
MLKRELVALLKTRDQTLARERKLMAKATAPLREEIDRLTSPEEVDLLLRAVIQSFRTRKTETLTQVISDFFAIKVELASKIVASLYTWQEEPKLDTSVQPEEREALRKEHFMLNQKLARQDAQIERLVIERTRARQKTQGIARLVSVYRKVLADRNRTAFDEVGD